MQRSAKVANFGEGPARWLYYNRLLGIDKLLEEFQGQTDNKRTGRCKMASEVLSNALSLLSGYLMQNYNDSEQETIRNEVQRLVGETFPEWTEAEQRCSYQDVQDRLSCINEKESIRKHKGVYYTPEDIVKFILTNSVKLLYGKLNAENFSVMELNISYRDFCFEKTVYDPTCGSGVFLLAALNMKLDLLVKYHMNADRDEIRKVVASIQGNDLNRDSIALTKIRLFLCVLHRCGVAFIRGLAERMERCFATYDFVSEKPKEGIQYDIVLGNPPYVEDSKSDSIPPKKYGNIYANVLEHAAVHLKPGGALGFVIPLSYVSTPRMKKIREELYRRIPRQYILSFSDRPDCLFTAVHQKLCVLFGKNDGENMEVYTGNYRYWYREERQELFRTMEIVKNNFVTEGYIPKLGTVSDVNIYQKIISQKTHLVDWMKAGSDSVCLNMRAAFWMKAFRSVHSGGEYKEFFCDGQSAANYCMCLLNSSLFWWYWICVSDCWHITGKELRGFKVPPVDDFQEADRLAAALEKRLEETKVYVGTKQTQYEYKHRECVDDIHAIDDYIHALYGLTETEGRYIKDFAYRYRISGGVEHGRN